jgi:hypothetical protein
MKYLFIYFLIITAKLAGKLAEVDHKVQQMSTGYSYQMVRKYLKITNKAEFIKLEKDLVEKPLLVKNMVSLNLSFVKTILAYTIFSHFSGQLSPTCW